MEDGRATEPASPQGDIRAEDAPAIAGNPVLLRAIAECAPDAIFVSDITGRIVEANERACASLGYSRDELLRLRVEDIEVEIAQERLTASRYERREELAEITSEGRQRRKDGSTFPIEVRSTHVMLDGTHYFIGVVRDISERRQAQDTAQQAADLTRAILNAAPDSVALIDKTGIIVDVNRQMAERLRQPPEGLIGRDIFSLVPPEIGARRRSWLKELTEEPEAKTVIERLGDVWLESTGHPVLDADGKLSHVAIFSRDVTAFKEAEESLRAGQEELERRVQDRTAELLASEQRFRDYAESGADRFYETDAEHRYTYFTDDDVNREMMPSESILGKRRWELPGVDPSDPIWAEHKAALDARKPFRDIRYSVERPDGVRLHVRASGKPVYDENGAFVGYRGTVTNVTREVEAARLANETRDIFNKAMQSMSEGLVLWDADRRFVYCNEFYRQMHDFAGEMLVPGLTYEEFLRRLAKENWESKNELGEEGWIRRGLETYADHSRVLVDCLDGRWIQVRKSGLTDGSVLIFFSDVTERQRHEAELQHQKTLFETVFNDVPDSIILADIDRRVVLTNPGFSQMFGYEPAEINGRATALLYDDADEYERQGRFRFNPEAKSEKRPYVVSYRRKSGEAFPGESIGTPITGPDGRVFGYIGVIRDITERLNAEQALRQAQKMEAVGQLTGGVAHDFNNLLAAILGNLELAAHRATDDPELLQRINRAISGAQAGGELTNRLLAFSRRQSLETRPTDMNEMVTGMNDLLARTLGEGVRIELALASGLPNVTIDPNQLETAILNIALNARDAMPEGGTLTFETGVTPVDGQFAKDNNLDPGYHATLAIADTGRGIEEDALEHVFEPFFTTKEIGQGSGLGLSMVFGYVKQSGGHVDIESELGRGTRVTLYFPLTVERTEEGAGVAREASAADTLPGGDGRTVYLIEDDPGVREATQSMLETLDYRVIDGGDGSDLAARLEGLPPIDILLSDVVLPGGQSGAEIAAQARRRFPGLKILLMTGYADAGPVAEGEGIETLRKPFQLEILAEKLDELAAGPPN